MLIIEVALGIVLAVVILRYWRELISVGILGGIAIVAISALIFGGYYLYENTELFYGILSVIAFAFFISGIYKVIEICGKRVSQVTLEKWNFTSGEIFGVLFIVIMVILGLFFIVKATISGEYNDIHTPIGSVFIFLGVVGGFVHIRDIKKSRDRRSNIDSNQE